MKIRSDKELIELINQYESAGEDLCELGEEVKLLSQSLIETGNVDQALTLMGTYTEVDWDDYGPDGYWEEHNQIVEILMQMAEQDALDDPGWLLNSRKSERPIFFRIGATLNPNLQETNISELLDELTPHIGEVDMTLDEQFMLIGLILNQNLSDQKFSQTFELLDLEMMEYVLSIAQGSAYSWGWLFQYAQEYMAESKNTEMGKKRILDYLANSNEEFLTPSIRFNDVNLGSKKEIIEAIEDNTYEGLALITIVANRNKELDGTS
jgi:hypothetical protein